MKNKICVYTCMTGDYDNVREILNKEEGVDYYFFTNNKNIKSNTWQVVYIEDKELNDFYLSRKIKMIGTDITNKYDTVVWQDASVQFKKSVKEFVEKYKRQDNNFVAFKHGERSSVAEEANACFRFFKDSKQNIEKLLKFYKKENYPDDRGLMEATVFIKNPKDEKVQETMKMWFDMLLKFGKRDQLLFPYCAYKTGLKIKWINEKVFENNWFDWSNHIQKKYPKEYGVYYGNVYNYNMENDFHYKYRIKDNKFYIKFTSKKESDITYININCNPCTEIKNLKVYGIRNYEIRNSIKYKDKEIFFNTFPFIVINKKLKVRFEIISQQKEEQIIQLSSKNHLKKIYRWAKRKTDKYLKRNKKNNKAIESNTNK